jgi:hypothetical protein
MNAVLTDRDGKAINFVSDFGMASLSQLAVAVFGGSKSSEAIARRRLKILTDHRLLSRVRYGQNTEFVYFCGRRPPIRQEHHMQLVDVYNALLRLGGQIEKWEREPDWGTLRPDAYAVYSFNGKRIHFAVEIERSNNPFNQQKYEQFLATQTMFKQSFPMVLIVTAKIPKIEPSKIKYVICKPDLKTISDIVKGV